MNFDKSKPHGTIWGGLLHGRVFQNGQVFDHEGNHLGDGSDAQAAPQLQAVQAPTADPAEAIANAQAAAAEHSGLLLKAVGLVEQAMDKVIAELEDLPDQMLDVIHKVESAGKQRAAVLDAILQTKGARAMQAAQDAQANGLTPAQAGLAPVTTAPAGDGQLSAQLSA